METIPFDVPETIKTPEPPFGMRHNEWLEARRKLAVKKSNAREKVRRIAKNGINEDQGYSFVEAADVYDLMRPILAECQLGFEVEYLTKRHERAIGAGQITDVDLRVTFTDLETGYFEQKMLNATGLDHGDKGIYKAYTGAQKYALILEFMIPTGGDAEGGRTPSKTAEEQPQQTAEGTTEVAITPEQIGQIKTKVLQLNKVPGQSAEARTIGIKATYSSLATKLEIKELNGESLTTLSAGQAEIALQHLDEWLEKRKQKAERDGAVK